MKRTGLTCLVVVALVLPGTVRAERQVYPLAEARVIASPEAAGRILLDFASLQGLQHVVVSSAYLEIPLPDAVLEQDLEICAYPLSRGWARQAATWTTPWSRAGGDLDESYFDEVTMSAGRRTGTLRLNVTQVVDEIVTRGAPSYGFILSAPLRRGDGFTEGQRALLGTMAGARLLITTANGRAAEPRGR